MFWQWKCLKFTEVCLQKSYERETFVTKTSSDDLRRNCTFEKSKVHSVYRGTESLSFLVLKIWNLLLVELKLLKTLYSLKLKIKNWVPLECPWRICET